MKRISYDTYEFKCEGCDNKIYLHPYTNAELSELLKREGWIIKIMEDELMYFCSEECANG